MPPRKHEGTKDRTKKKTFGCGLLRDLRVFVVTAGFCSVCCSGPPAQADLHPISNQNVLLITIDTLRADALGSYGGAAATPALDRLAADGVRFDFAHAHAVTTLTSHASILTGTYPFQHGIRDNSGYRLAPGARTLATLLRQAGFQTAAFVSAFPVHSRFGLNQGFDLYDDRFGETRAPTEFVMPERPAAQVVPLARTWIAGGSGAGRSGGAGSNRWFVWLHLFDPHAPYTPPPPFDAQYAGRPYDGEVAATDAALAPLLDALRGAARPTLVIVTGDHGEGLGDHGELSHGLFAYESTLRVPLIVADIGGTQTPPGAQRRPAESFVAGLASLAFPRTKAAGGEVSPVAARHVDILPTILEAVGQAPPGDLPGRSLLAASERRAGAPARTSYFEAMGAMLNRGWAPLSGVLADRDKFIDLPIPERYALDADPAERVNLSGRDAARDRTLAASLRGFDAAQPGARRAEDGDAAARLRALGYVAGSAPAKTRYTAADDPKQLVDLDQAVHNAVEAVSARRFADAVQIYERVIARRPDMAIAYRHLAFVEWQRGNANGAIAVLQRALRGNAAPQPALVAQLGGYLADTGDVRAAILLLEPLAGTAAADPETLNALGIAYVRAGRRDEAARTFERVLAINPDSSVPLENLGVMALERGDLAAARRSFERAVRADPRSSPAHAGLGVVFLRSGDRAGAIAAWKQAVQLDPRNVDALYNAGTTLARDGQLTAARPYLEQFLKTAPPAFYAKDLKEVAALLQQTVKNRP
jgi:arylsulfatase A-like enzyme/Flp pilus assembly protein TadD